MSWLLIQLNHKPCGAHYNVGTIVAQSPQQHLDALLTRHHDGITTLL
jgi:hypothetical protein